MADRRHAADRVAGRLAHEIGVGAGNRLADCRRDFRLVDATSAGRDDEVGAAALRAAEHQRFGDLSDRAADRRRRVRRGARAGVELKHLEPVAERGLNS